LSLVRKGGIRAPTGRGAALLENYLPLIFYGFLLTVVGAGAVGISFLLPRILRLQKPNRVKQEPYECGVPPIGDPGARGRFSVRFYLVAILFILFDIETVFLVPWAVTFRSLGVAAFVEVLVFVGILIAGYVYVWKRRALEWD
jgi:NADH-quinone oxidoreductase subunit A